MSTFLNIVLGVLFVAASYASFCALAALAEYFYVQRVKQNIKDRAELEKYARQLRRDRGLE